MASHKFAHPDAGEPDRRVAASLTLLGVVICAALFALTPRPASGLVPAAGGNRLTEAPPRVVKIVDGPARSDVCAEQTWPHYDARCLARR